MDLIASLPADYAALQGAKTWRGHTVPPGGLEPSEVLQMLRTWSARLHQAQGWGSWLGVERGEVVVSLAVKNPLSGGAVDLGYAVAPARRGQGVATAAVRALLPILAAHGARLVRAETARDNPASARVLQKAGFAPVGERSDPEDGLLDLWQATLPTT